MEIECTDARLDGLYLRNDVQTLPTKTLNMS